MIDLASLVLAINISAPSLNAGTAAYYAKHIQTQAVRRDLDELLIVAIITHESNWNARAISPDGKDFGLMQIRSQYLKRTTEAQLLEGTTNINVGSAILEANKNFCDNFVGERTEPIQYLSCYGGSCTTKQRMCKPTAGSKRVSAFRECLYNSLLDQTHYQCKNIYYNKR